MNDSPTGLHAVRALEQCRIPDHAVINQGFVAGARSILEVILVVEIHMDLTQLDGRAGNFSAKGQRGPLIRLQFENECVGFEFLSLGLAEE